MANIMIPSLLTQTVPGAGLDLKAQLPQGGDGSFALHLDRQLREGEAVRDNLAGVKGTVKSIFTESDTLADTPVTVEALLQQLMMDLQGVVDKPHQAPGEWTFQLKDMGLLEKLATAAGMDSKALAPLRKMMDEQGSLPLSNLFSALADTFKEMDAATEVTVAETYLPLVETFLSKLGVAPETIQQLDGQAVNGIGQLDLKALLHGLQQIPPPGDDQQQGQQCLLSDWDVEQLQTMLADAGMRPEEIARIIPERPALQQKAMAGLRPEEGDLQVTMSVERLRSVLEQVVAAVEAARPRADMPSFFDQLNTILTQAGFESHDVGMSPVVQGALADAYEELGKMVDLAMVKVEKGPLGDGPVSASALELDRILRALAARQERREEAMGLETNGQAHADEVTDALQQAIAALESSPSRKTEQTQLLTQVNTLLAPAGLQLTALDPITISRVAEQDIPLTPAAVSQLFSDAINEVASEMAQGPSLPTLMASVNRILAQAGLEIGQGNSGQTQAMPASNPPPDPLVLMTSTAPQLTVEAVSQLFEQAFSQGENFSRQGAPLAMVVERVNDILAPDEFTLNPLAAETGISLADLANSREGKKAEITAKNDVLATEWLASGKTSGDAAVLATEPGMETVTDEPIVAQTAGELLSKESGEQKKTDGGLDLSNRDGITPVEAKGSSPLQSDPAFKAQPPRLRLSPELQQLAVEQISQGVLRGLRNMEHHLTLTMYPKELGEVKVDMQVRGHHIAVSFVMENQKVKEALESNMGEFKDNLERRGFSLGAMSVSVDQQQNHHDGGRRFVAAWEQMQASQQGEERRGSSPLGATPLSANRTTRTPQGGISLFV